MSEPSFPLALVHRVARAIGTGDYVDDSLLAAAWRALDASGIAAYIDFVEEVAGSCIPTYEEAKADAQRLLAPAQGIEARSDTTGTGVAEGESPVAKPCAQKETP